VLYMTRLLRNLGATSDGIAPVNSSNTMDQRILYSPTVFNYFHPDWTIQDTAVPPNTYLAPEFEIQTTATMANRANFVNSFAAPATVTVAVPYTPFTGTTVDYSPYASIAGDVPALLDALDLVMMHGQMSTQMRQSVQTAVQAVAAANASQRARTAVYLIGTSSQYQVIH